MRVLARSSDWWLVDDRRGINGRYALVSLRVGGGRGIGSIFEKLRWQHMLRDHDVEVGNEN